MVESIKFIPNNSDFTPSQEAINEFRESLGYDLGNITRDITYNDLKQLLRYYEEYYTQLNQILNILHDLDSNIVELQKRYNEDHIGFTRDGQPPSINYIIYKEIQNHNLNIVNILKNGYRLINLSRQLFTNEKIVYEVGIEKTSQGRAIDVRNFEVSEEEILKMSGLSYNTSAKKVEDLLKLNITVYGDTIKEKQESENYIEKILAGKETIFGKVVSVLTNEKYLQRLNIKTANRGFIYEAYKNILKSRQMRNKNSQGITPNEIISAYRKVTKTNFTAAGFYSGGDLFNVQYKLLSKKPQIVSMNTLVKFVFDFKEQLKLFLETNNKQDFINYLQNKLVQDASGRTIIDKAVRSSQEIAKENIELVINNL